MAATDTKVLFSRGAFDINHQLSDGLYVRVEGGILLNGLGYHGIQGAHLLLTASVTNYIECSAVGVVSANVTGFTPGATPLYEVKMGATTITSCNDWRNADVALGGAAVAVRSEAAALAVNDLVYVSGWNETYGLPLVTKADADVSGRQAQFVMRAALAQNANGMAFTAFRTAANLNTLAAGAVGDPVYLDATTAGGWTLTAPVTATGVVQVVGHVAVDSATVGVIEFDLRDFPTVGTNDIQPDAVTNAKIADDQIDSEHYVAGSIDTEHYAADSVTAQKIPPAAFGLAGVTPVAVAHDAASPFEILVADAANDRIALVAVNATEAAAGAPDIDIGTAGTINAVVDDFGAGVWALNDRVWNIIRIPATENLRATITAAGTAGVLNVYVHILTPVAQTANIADNAVTDGKILSLGVARAFGARDIGRTCAGYFELTGVVADTQTVTINGRVYEYDTNAAITGDILVDVTADQTADAAITALVAAVNADAARTVNAVAWVGNTDVSSGCSFIGIIVSGLNVTLAETCANGAVGATPAVGARNIGERDVFWGTYAVTAADVTTWALAAGNSIPIAGLPTTVAPLLVGLVCTTAAGAVKSLATVAFTMVQANAQYFVLTVDDPGAVLAATDVINFYAIE